jgi:hypothetical protein
LATKQIPNPTNQTQIQNRIDVKSKISDEVIQSRESNSGINTRLKKGFLTDIPKKIFLKNNCQYYGRELFISHPG